MRFQSGPGYCGAAAIVNALRCFGERVREETVAKHAGTTREHGTQEHGIKQALERFECSFEDIIETRYATAQEKLVEHLTQGRPVIMLVESGNHWVTAVGLLGNRVIIYDSQNYAWNKAENGVHIVELGTSLREFWLPYEGKRQAIVVKRD